MNRLVMMISSHRRDLLALSSFSRRMANSIKEEATASSCWSCFHRIDRGGLTCQGCSKLQPLSTHVDYYDLFGLPNMSYEIDLGKLDAQYKSLQWLVHPDLSSSRTEEEKAFGAVAVTRLNEAFSVLKSPLLRARYLLQQRGISTMDEATVVTDVAFLAEVMEAREEVEEAEEVPVLESLLRDTRERARGIVGELGGAFGSESVESARDLTMKLTYLTRLEEEIRSKLPTSYVDIKEG